MRQRQTMRHLVGVDEGDAAMDEIHYKDWRIEVLPDESGWEALVYCSGSPLHEKAVPHGPDRRAVIEEAKALIDRNRRL
jgi:hypothetical protein